MHFAVKLSTYREHTCTNDIAMLSLCNCLIKKFTSKIEVQREISHFTMNI